MHVSRILFNNVVEINFEDVDDSLKRSLLADQ